MLGRPTVRSFVDAWAPPPKGLWSSCEHDRGAVSITVSKSVAKIQQLAQSFDCEHLRMTTLPVLLFAIGVRPRPRNLHGAAIEVLNDEAMLVRLQHLELVVQQRMMGTDDLHPLRRVSKDILSL